MDWLVENLNLVFSLVSLAGVIAVWGYVTYWHDRDRLWRDLEKLVHEGLEYLQEWAAGQLEVVTRDDTDWLADVLYVRYVKGTALDGLVSQEQMRSLLWEAFVVWRDRFVGIKQAISSYAISPRVARVSGR
ncbi:MAG: hypothetical protein FJ014_13235 [Chloroflexi bacterium]|nr:hypothetical protein [Chloroflexota bacterium]